MRLAIITASLFISSQAFACGMYIPPEMKVASIGSIMEIVEEDKADDGIVAAADVNLAEVEKVPVIEAGFQGIQVDEVEVLDKKALKKLKKARKNAPNS